MARRMEDIRPTDHRSIRDVPVESERKARGERGKIQNEGVGTRGKPVHISRVKSDDREPVSSHKISLTPPEKHRRKSTGMRWFLLVIGVIVIFAGLGYIASVYFARASFTITPKTISSDINSTYLAQDSTQGPVAASGTIPYSFITVKGSATTTVPASVGPAVSTKAQGPVTIYNSFSATAQRLVAGTRLVNASGKVYRLTGSVVVPGYTLSAKVIVPGNINSSIVADQPGDAYNITGDSSVSDLQIVAYKGTPKYGTIYGRITAPVTGGMTGTQSIVSPIAVASSTEMLKAGIISNLIKQIHATLPAGYVMYDSGYVATFSTSTSSGADKTQAVLTVEGTVSGMIFKKTDLVNRLAGATTTLAFGPFKYDILGLESLSVQIMSGPASTTKPVKITAKSVTSGAPLKQIISMKIRGTVQLVGIIPTDEIIKKLLGKNSLEAQNVFKQYDQIIEKVDGEVMPPWSKIPTNPSRISLNVKG